MQSELHERLEYLVNYSSQLIFVSGDSAAQQALASAEYGSVQNFLVLYRALGGGADEARLQETLAALDAEE